MAVIRGSNFGVEICDAMGIDYTNVRRITLNVEADDAARVEIERFVQDSETKGIKEVLEQYELVEKSVVNKV